MIEPLSTHEKEMGRMRVEMAGIANTCLRGLKKQIPQNGECLDAFEQYAGAVHVFFKYADDPDACAQARDFMRATEQQFRYALNNHREQ